MLYKFFLSITLFCSFLFGVSQEASDIKNLYKSLAKDFVMYEYIKSDKSTKEDAMFLYEDIYRKTNQINKAFAKKINDPSFFNPKKTPTCKQKHKNDYLYKCVYSYISPKYIQNANKKQIQKIKNDLKKIGYKKDLLWIHAMLKKDTFKALSKLDGKYFLKVFNGVNDEYRLKKLNHDISLKFLTNLANQKNFTNFVLKIAMDKKFKTIANSLTKLNPNRKILTYDSAFYLALMALNQDSKQKALKFLKRASELTTSKYNLDKVKFWQYLITKNEKTLASLSQGSDLNFYTLLAKEKVGLNNFEIIRPLPKHDINFDTLDPFLWAKIMDLAKSKTKDEQVKFAKTLYAKNTLAQYTFLMERASSFRKYYFITPYEELLKDVDLSRKILIYSIARQESRFVLASVSTSYALGMMQFMPFLAKATAKKLNLKDFKYFDIFKPQIALNFANDHLDFLEKYLQSPLFIAYAYNGGIGFTKNLLTKRQLFANEKYDPYMSMELVYYKESREYGKKVLVNYVQYSKTFHQNTTLHSLLKDLTSFEKSVYFK